MRHISALLAVLLCGTASAQLPSADFIGSPTAGNAPLDVAFTDLSGGQITSWSWDFGDGGTSTQQSPDHIYAAVGSYSVSLTVTGPGGVNQLTRPNYVTVGAQSPVADFSASPQSGTAPLNVSFSDSSSGPITNRSWDFGDGGTSSSTNPSHTYMASGVYTVSLTVAGPGGVDTQTRSNYIVVSAAAPDANFVGSPTGGSVPLLSSFTDLSTGEVSSWSWGFGDGGTSTQQNPSHTYNASGTYSVSLTVAGPGGADSRTRTDYVTVNDTPPSAEFTGSPTSGAAPLDVSFTDQSTGTITGRSWDFGDGNTSTLENPDHTYTATGNYTVTLTATGPGGSDTRTRTAYITATTAPPEAVFTASPTSGSSPLEVDFTDLSSGQISTWSWNFGDGGTSALQNPAHTYTASGTYTVSLDVTGPAGTDNRTVNNLITVTAGAPTAGFVGSPTSGTTPLLVAFTSLASGEIDTYAWDFGDGSTSNGTNPSHLYLQEGSYSVSLTVTGPGGADTRTLNNYVTTTVPAPRASFAGAPTSGSSPLVVVFTDQSLGQVASWSWDFGDGQTSTLENPSHTYSSGGVYSVALTVTGPGGSDTFTRNNYINVSATPPTADFIGTPTAGTAPLAVSFSDISIGEVTSWSWDFGDGATSTDESPLHTYTQSGDFTVALTVTGPGGSDTRTATDYISVTPAPPMADFFGAPTAGTAPLNVTFGDLSTGEITSWVWNFGDGATSNLPSPSHIYAASGTYPVTLTVIGPGGSDTMTRLDYIVVTPPAPSAGFIASPTSGASPLTAVFSDLSVGEISTWDWDFGDGNTSTQQNPTHIYSSEGSYTVSLTVTAAGGVNTLTRFNYINVAGSLPVAGFSGSPTAGASPLTVNFSDFSTGDITSRLWSFGDGATSTLEEPSHTYATSGVFTVSLTVSGPGGANTLRRTDYVNVSAASPSASFVGTPTTGAAPLAVTFSDTSTGEITDWSWTFGDGGTSTAQNPTHTYTTSGVYSVTLQVSGRGGQDSRTRTNYITALSDVPTAAFTGAPTQGVAPLGVSFADQSSGEITSRLWDFGDGSTSTLANPAHVYQTSGVYSVSLTVNGPGGSDTATQADFVKVGPAEPVADFAGSPTTGAAPLTVGFNDQSTGEIVTWSWDFGDGSTSSAQNPTHVYPASGIYSVSLNVVGGGGSDTRTRNSYIVVNASAPSAAFSGSPTAGSAPLAVAFSDLSTGEVTGWSWDFGDGANSSAQSPNHVYSQPGSYTVSMTASGPGGSDSMTETNYIVVAEPAPVADFIGSPTNGAAPLSVSFNDSSIGQVTSWAWDFGDGQASTLENPTHTYVSGGTYTVAMTIIGPGGTDTRTRTDFVTVSASPPSAAFVGSPTAGSAPLDVSFFDLSDGEVTSWAWDFGDGSTSTLEHPNHVYTTSGAFSVSLTVTGPGGSDSETRNGYITAAPAAPEAEFTASQTSGNVPLNVNFSDQSTGQISSWSWDFGDGATSSAQSPSHSYTAAGFYTVALTVVGPSGVDTETKLDYITVTDGGPLANFSGSPTGGLVPLNVAFIDNSAGNVNSWSWDFGDGGTSTQQNPNHTYVLAGDYSVSLTVSGPQGSDTLTRTDYINATTTPPAADFDGSPTSGQAPLTVTFTDESSGQISNWMWDFGDGSTSTQQSPEHTYNSSGVYTVELTVTGPGGSDTFTRPNYIEVTAAPPTANFVGSPTTGMAPLTVNFSDLSTGDVSTRLWSFGDGGTSMLQDPSHTYNSNGEYTVALTVTGPLGTDSLTRTGYITVSDIGVPEAEILPFQEVENLDFGAQVDVDVDWMVVGATGGGMSAEAPSGSAVVYERVGTRWLEHSVLQPGDLANNARFGFSVSTEGNRIAIGAPFDTNGGSAYVYTLIGGQWVQEGAKLTASDAVNGDFFGGAVSINGNRVAVGAPLDDDGGPESGSVYVFERNGSNWNQAVKLVPNTHFQNDRFGGAVSIDGNSVMVGTPLADGIATNSGFVFWFTGAGANWNQMARIAPADGMGGAQFGFSVELDDQQVIIGAPRDPQPGTNGGAAYVFTRNGGPWSQQAKLLSSDGEDEDQFGIDVSLRGDYAAVGALEDTGANNRGAAYTFERVGSNWSELQKLQDSGGVENDQFGAAISLSSPNGPDLAVASRNSDVLATEAGLVTMYRFNGSQYVFDEQVLPLGFATGDTFATSVAVDGDTAAIGAPADDGTGSVSIFRENAGSWDLEAKIVPGQGGAFGTSVALSGDRLIVGDPLADGAASGSGIAYVYDRSGSIWSETETLTGVGGMNGDLFGSAVDVDGDIAVVGAEMANGNQAGSGALYAFFFDGGAWNEESRLDASNGVSSSRFGASVAVEADVVIGGAPDQGAGGSAYVYRRNGGAWPQEARLGSASQTAGGMFGSSVDVLGTTIVVGASHETGAVSDSGATYVFVFNGTLWLEQQKISAPGGAAGDLYGASVSLFDNLAVIGAPGSNVGPIESGSAWTHRRIGTTWSASGQFAPDDGVDGDLFGVVSTDGSRILIGSPEHDHVGDGAGSAYVFPVDTTIGMNYCGPAALNSAGLSAKILALGSARVADNNFSIRAIDMPPNQFGYIITGMNQGMAMPPGSDGFICMVGNIGRFDHQIGNSGAEGSFTEQLDLTLFPINPPTPVFVGDTYNFQVWFRDVGNRSNFTDGLTVTFE